MSDAAITQSPESTDSPLSVSASIAGILTFVFAVAAAAYVRITYLRNVDQEYFQVKTSLSWYKTESTWMHDLVNADKVRNGSIGNAKEYQMYVFVMDQLGKLEERLLSLLTQTELQANKDLGKEKNWTVIPGFRPTGTATAVSWLSVRTKALELVRQRDALGSRVLFAQLCMITSRVLDQEVRAKKQEEALNDRLDQLERMVRLQGEKFDRFEALAYNLQSNLDLRHLPSTEGLRKSSTRSSLSD